MQPSYLKPSCSWVAADQAASPWVPQTASGRTTPGISPNCMYLYFPYLNFDTYRSIVRRRNLIKRRINHGRAAPVPQQIADLESLEMRVMWEYIGFDPPLNCRRTLDQFGYPSLQDTNARDDDQMLYKLTKKDPSREPARPLSGAFRFADIRPTKAWSTGSSQHSAGSNENDENEDDEYTSGDDTCYEEEGHLRDGNLLMVDTLWLWAIDTCKFCPRGWGGKPAEWAVTDPGSYAGDLLPQKRVKSSRGNAVPTSRPSKQCLQRTEWRPHWEN